MRMLVKSRHTVQRAELDVKEAGLTLSFSFLISLGVRQSAFAMSGMVFTFSCRAFMNSTSTGRKLRAEIQNEGQESPPEFSTTVQKNLQSTITHVQMVE